jgi:hypothetical protein
MVPPTFAEEAESRGYRPQPAFSSTTTRGVRSRLLNAWEGKPGKRGRGVHSHGKKAEGHMHSKGEDSFDFAQDRARRTAGSRETLRPAASEQEIAGITMVGGWRGSARNAASRLADLVSQSGVRRHGSGIRKRRMTTDTGRATNSARRVCGSWQCRGRDGPPPDSLSTPQSAVRGQSSP